MDNTNDQYFEHSKGNGPLWDGEVNTTASWRMLKSKD